MTTNGTTTETVRGVVERANERGVKLAAESGWRNWSRWGERPEVPPSRGDAVELVLDNAGYIRRVTVLDAAAGVPAGTPALREREYANDGTQDDILPAPANSRETLIVRQTCLKAAAEFAAGRPEIKSADVLKIAEAWEGWVTRWAGATTSPGSGDPEGVASRPPPPR
jgi:hypothetical protein